MDDIDGAVKAEFRENTRHFLQDRYLRPEARKPDAADPVLDKQAWRDAATDMALQGLSIAENLGGSGFGYELAAIVFEELGRQLTPAPFLATVGLAAEVIRGSDDASAMQRYLPAIATGELIATLAISERGSGLDRTAYGTSAARAPDDDGDLVTGCKTLVLDAHLSDMIVVAACRDGASCLFAVETKQKGVKVTRQLGIDATRHVSTVEFNQATATPIGTTESILPALRKGLAIARIYLASEMIGGAQYLLEQTATYATTRIQFGATIGSLQAVQHRCADMYIALQFARSAVWAALEAADSSLDKLALYAGVAKLASADAFVKVAEGALQVHGGIGFTWEHFLHYYLKRAKASQFLLGTPAEIRATIGRDLGLYC